jgi:copper chaperone CopZ
MKIHTTVASLLIALFSTLAAAADEAKTSYTAEVKGIVCQVCAGEVKTAFAKLPGVKEVEIKKVENSELSLVTFAASSDKLTVEDCERALGDKLMKEFPVVKVTAKK